MASVNKVILIGNLGRDPELKYTPGGNAVCNFTLATNERWVDKSGAKQERTEWHRIVVWGKQAEICGQYLKKGGAILVEGRLQMREWLTPQGEKRQRLEIRGESVHFLEKVPGSAAAKEAVAEPEEGNLL